MRRRTFTGAGIAAAAVAAALALSGCSSDSGNDGKKEPTASATATQAPTAAPNTAAATGTGTPSAPGASGDPTTTVDGVWLAAQGSNKVQLVLGKGEAGLTSTHLCGGTYTDQDGIGLTLTCMDGNKDRTSGVGVLASDGKTLTVQWTGGLKDTFSRTGLPSN